MYEGLPLKVVVDALYARTPRSSSTASTSRRGSMSGETPIRRRKRGWCNMQGVDERRVLMAPSILSADFLDLRADVSRVADGADFIHVDVIDGHFTPNLTIGPGFVKALKRDFDTPLDVHLMVSNPESTVDWYLDAGADLVTAHVEALTHGHRFMSHVHERGARVGIALNPATPSARRASSSRRRTSSF